MEAPKTSQSKMKSEPPTYTTDFIKHDTDHAVFLGSAMIDNIMTALIALSSEVWTARRRNKVLEATLEKHGILKRELTEAYMPTPEENARWTAERDGFVRTMFDPFLRQADIPFSSSMDPTPNPKK